MGFTREDRVNDQMFIGVARALKKTKALDFIKWWRQKQGDLKNNQLWEKRTLIVHRGYPDVEYRIYVLGSGANSFTLSGYDYLPEHYAFKRADFRRTPTGYQYDEHVFSDFPDESILELCTCVFKEMEAIVKEAETKFGIIL